MDIINKKKYKNISVLYVEDEKIILDSIIKILNVFFNNIYSAENGEVGLEIFKNNNIDLVITDIEMPHMNGIDMAREIKKIKDVPVIITTAYVDSSYLMEAIDIGIDKYLTKPARANKLMLSIDGALEPFLLKKEIEEKNKQLEEMNLYLEQKVQDEILKNKEKDLLILKQSKLVSVDKLSSSHFKELKFYAKDMKVLIYEKINLFEDSIDNLIKDYFYCVDGVVNNFDFYTKFNANSYDIIILSLDEKAVFEVVQKIRKVKMTQKIIPLIYFKNYSYDNPIFTEFKDTCLIEINDIDKLFYTLLLEAENINFDKRKELYKQRYTKKIEEQKAIVIEEDEKEEEIIEPINEIQTIVEAKTIPPLIDFKNEVPNVIKINPNDFDLDDIKSIKDDLEQIVDELLLDRIKEHHLKDIHFIFTRFYNTFYTFLGSDLKLKLKSFAEAVKDIGDFLKSLNYYELDDNQKATLSMIEHIIDDIVNFISIVFIDKEISNLNYLESSLKDNLQSIKIELGLEKKEESGGALLFF